jgi:hypothetical protein
MSGSRQDDKSIAGLPAHDWVYFATPEVGRGPDDLRDFVVMRRIIVAHVYLDGAVQIRMPLVRYLRAGQSLLLAYGGHGRPYFALLSCTIAASADPVRTPQHSFGVFCCIGEPLCTDLIASGHVCDPIIKELTGICWRRLVTFRGLPFANRRGSIR